MGVCIWNDGKKVIIEKMEQDRIRMSLAIYAKGFKIPPEVFRLP